MEGIALSSDSLSRFARNEEDVIKSDETLRGNQVVYQQLKAKESLAHNFMLQAEAARVDRRYKEATDLLILSQTIYEDLGNREGIAASLNSQGLVAKEQGQYAVARELLEKSLDILKQIGRLRNIAICYRNLGEVAFTQHDFRAAYSFYGQNLRVYQQRQDTKGIAACLYCMATLSITLNNMKRAACLLGAQAAFLWSLEISSATSSQSEHDLRITTLCTSLGENAFTEAWDAGRAMTLDEAVAYALSDDSDEGISQ